MKSRNRILWLFFTPLLVPLLLGVSHRGGDIWRYYYGQKVSVSIGYFADDLAQERAAIRRLSAEMKSTLN